MLEQINNPLTYVFGYIDTATRLGATGLDGTVYVYRVTDGTLVDSGALVELGHGLYRYVVPGVDTANASMYAAAAEVTSTDVDVRSAFGAWSVGNDWVERIDALISETAVPGDAMTLEPGVTVDAVFVQTPAEIAAAVQGDRLTLQRDVDWVARLYITGGISATRDNLIFTVKTKLQKKNGASDSQSVLQISEDVGLLYINQAAGTSSKGSLTVVDEADADGNGVVDLRLDSDTAAQLQPDDGFMWDIKEIDAGADLVRAEGLMDIVASVTRTIS